MNDIMGYVRTHRQSEVLDNSESSLKKSGSEHRDGSMNRSLLSVGEKRKEKKKPAVKSSNNNDTTNTNGKQNEQKKDVPRKGPPKKKPARPEPPKKKKSLIPPSVEEPMLEVDPEDCLWSPFKDDDDDDADILGTKEVFWQKKSRSQDDDDNGEDAGNKEDNDDNKDHGEKETSKAKSDDGSNNEGHDDCRNKRRIRKEGTTITTTEEATETTFSPKMTHYSHPINNNCRGESEATTTDTETLHLTPMEKLKLAHSKLEENGYYDDNNDDNNGKRGGYPKKDFINLLESSISDLQRQESDSKLLQFQRSRSESHLSKKSKKSSGSRKSRSGRHRSRGRSTGGSTTGHSTTGRSHRSRGSKGGESHRSHRSRGSKGDNNDSPSTKDGSRRDGRVRRKKSRSRSRRMNDSEEWGGSTRSWGISGGASSSSSQTMMAPVPKEVKMVLACVRGSEALPRESVVSSVVRRLVSRIDRGEDCHGSGASVGNNAVGEEDGGGGSSSSCVAILSCPSEDERESFSDGDTQHGGGGEGKTTIAALTCIRGDVRTRYHHGIAWLNLGEYQPLAHNFESYSKALSQICRQLGIQPQTLRLSPVVRTPGEDAAVSRLRMEGYMKEAHGRMGKLLTSLQRKRTSSRRGDYNNGHDTASVLIVLDDVATPLDISWFQFQRTTSTGGKKQINDLLITSRLSQLKGVGTPITVPPLETKEAVQLLLTESDLPRNGMVNQNYRRVARGLVKQCMLHPLTIKFAGRWLSLKRATSGGQKGADEILGEVHRAIIDGSVVSNDNNEVDVLYALLSRSMSPLVMGKETKIVRLCFAALMTVFYKETCSSTLVPLEIANDFFLKVVENEKEILSREDTFFQNNGRQASKLVPEILGALGIFNITKHTTAVEGYSQGNKESSIQIDHDLIRCFSHRIQSDASMSHLVKDNAENRWNAAYVQSYFQRKAKCLWDDIQPDRSRRYALEKMPTHMILADMFEDAETLMQNESFIRGRFWSLGWTEGTRVHVNDAEAFCRRLMEVQQESSLANNNNENDGDGCSSPTSKLVNASKQLEAVLMEEVARESGGPNGRCSTLEAGRCLHEISVSLAKFNLWDEASRFCDSCVELVESNLGPSELVASLLYNSSIMHMEANDFEKAETKIADCLDMRVKTCGTESILYVRALCQLGDILSVSSDYSAAESCFNKSIGILKVMPAQYHLDFGVALYKLGRNQHRRGGCLDEALHCYEEALEFEKNELGSNHIFMATILMRMGDLLLDKDDTQQAKHTFKEAIDALNEADNTTTSPLELKIKFAIAKGKLRSIMGQSDECIEKYQDALAVLQKHTPAKKRAIAQINSMIGAEHEKKCNYHAAEKCYEESVSTMKSAFGPFHLDIAETLINLSGVKCALGEVKKSNTLFCEHHAQATECLKEAIDIQKSRLGDCCEEVAITLTILGSHLKTIGAHEKAELAYSDAVRILQELEGDQDLSLVDALLGTADLMTAMSKYGDAIEYYIQCLKIQNTVFGMEHDDIATTLYAMGLMKHDEGLYSQALVYFAKALVMRVNLHGDAHSVVGDIYDMMGFVEAKNGELDSALLLLTDALKTRKSVGDRLKEADTLINIGNLHRERNEFEMALQRYDDCLNIRISELGRNSQSVADVLMAIGNVHSDMGNPQDTLSSYREALEIFLAVNGPTDAVSVASTFQKVGMVQFRAGNLENGRLFLEKAVEIYRQGGKGYESNLITPLFIIGNIHKTLEQAEEAQRVWNDAFEMSKKMGDQSNPEVHQILSQLLQAN
mmetsp:Transcript_28020/g.59757  ORF Transcript_28020/g.59757 Transcript_28020/m.59757 type:complete len:1770 (+) Transcript_28020:1-5310(+)